MLRPGYVIADPELIKNITIKDFDHFVNHIEFGTNDLFSKTLFLMKGKYISNIQIFGSNK